MNDDTYRCVGEGDYHCSLAKIAAMIRDAHEMPPDGTLRAKTLLKDLDWGR